MAALGGSGAVGSVSQRMGAPEEFAALVEHVISNRYVNGEVLRIDGALRPTPR